MFIIIITESNPNFFSGLVQILEQIDKFNLKPNPAKGLVKGAALIVSIMPKDQVLLLFIENSTNLFSIKNVPVQNGLFVKSFIITVKRSLLGLYPWGMGRNL